MEKFNVYQNFNNSESVKLAEYGTLEEALAFVKEELTGYEILGKDNGCSEEVFASGKVGNFEIFEGSKILYDEDGYDYDIAEPVYESHFFYTGL